MIQILKHPDEKSLPLLQDASLCWYDPAQAPFQVSGLYGFEGAYQRFPQNASNRLFEFSPHLHELSLHTSGGQIRFQTDACRLVVAARLNGVHTRDNFTAIGECGMDCYVAYPGEPYRFESAVRYNQDAQEYIFEFFNGIEPGYKQVLLNLPLYMGVEAIRVAVPTGAKIDPPQPFTDQNPLVFYGSSITQGGCASRPGLSCSNQLSRLMNREILNFGFAGSGMGEPEVATLLSEIPNPALYLLSYEPNAADKIYDTLNHFLDILRNQHPEIPIVVISSLWNQREYHKPEKRLARDQRRDFQRQTVWKRKERGDKHVFFIDGSTLLPDCPDECFVDGLHPNDFGFCQISKCLLPYLKEYL